MVFINSTNPSCSNYTASATGVFNCTPVTGDIITNYYAFRVRGKDPYFADTGYQNITHNIRINANRAPVYNTSRTITPQEHKAGTSFSITFETDMFSDPEGEPLSYSFNASGVDLTSWLSLDSATRTFTGNPVPNSDVGNYTI